MASLKQWSASGTLRSLTENGRGGAMRTAGASTMQKWPERSPLSPRQTERIPGLVTSDKLSVIIGPFHHGLGKANHKQCSVISTTSGLWKHWQAFILSNTFIICTIVVGTICFPSLPKVTILCLQGCFFYPHLILNTGLKSENESCALPSVNMREIMKYMNAVSLILHWQIEVNV